MTKKVLIITRNLPPMIGGMERLNWHIADELCKNNNVYLISHKKAKTLAPKDVVFHSVPLDPLLLFLIFTFLKTLWVCLIKRPDILFAGSGLTAPITVFWAKFFRKKSLIYIHGLDIGTSNKLYNRLWLPFIRSADSIIANSSSTYELCLNKGIAKEKLHIIYPGVTFPAPIRNDQLIKQIKQKYNLQHSKILISVGRLTQRKGLNEFIEHSLLKIVQAIPEVKLIIIGDTPNQSLNKNLQSKALILSTAKKFGIESNIIFTGNISDDALLSSFYYLADAHIFPVKHIPDDPEGFGMVAIESAAHGLPTVAFATGGIIDAVKNNVSGYLVEIENYASLTNKTIKLLKHPEIIHVEKCKSFADKFSWQNLNKKFDKIIT